MYYQFQSYDLDKKIKCRDCSKLSHLRAWKCNCGILWHTCTVHSCIVKAPQGAAEKARGANEKIVKISNYKRLLENASTEHILDDDLKNEARKAKRRKTNSPQRSAEPNFRLKASMLPPNLRHKFAHLFRE